MNLEKFQQTEYKKQQQEFKQKLKTKVDDRPEKLKHTSSYDIAKCRIISFYAEKGGVGKTTNTIHLAYTFAQQGKRVLIYDCDTQLCLTSVLLGLSLNNENVNNLNQNNEIPNTDNLEGALMGLYLNEPRITLTSLIESEPLMQGYHRTLYEQVTDNSDTARPVQAIHVAPNIWLAPGNREMNKLDQIITMDETMASIRGGNISFNKQNHNLPLCYLHEVKLYTINK